MLTRCDSTGVTGYIAGDALFALNKKHPDYEYAALVRTQEKADIVKKAYPNIRIVLGGLDDSDILKEEAAKADIVLRTHALTHALTSPFQNTELTPLPLQTPPTPPTMPTPPKPSHPASSPAPSPATGFTRAVPASSPTLTPPLGA